MTAVGRGVGRESDYDGTEAVYGVEVVLVAGA
jgi:hypothetical protein